MSYEYIISEVEAEIGIITLNRPQALNALSSPLMNELKTALDDFEYDDNIAVIIITGNEKAFAAGADIKEMKDKTFVGAYAEDFISCNWERVSTCRKPVIAGVAGYALGGGCELAMMCDFIIAADNAHFGQPEINLGIIPGFGGTQRLTRLIGKSKAMEMCLTGRMMDAEEAERSGLISRIVPLADLQNECRKVARKIAALSRPSTLLAKESVNHAHESTLREGIHFERRMFHALFATEDQKEGMAAFAEKRRPEWKHR